MSSSQAVSRTEGPSSATWEMHKETIKKLYIKENMPLKDVIDIMRVDHGLVASVKMYKYRLKTWGLRKNQPIRRRTSGNLDSDSNLSCGSCPVTRTSSPLPHPLSTTTSRSSQSEQSGATENILRILNRYFSSLDDPSTVPFPQLSAEELYQIQLRRQHGSMEMLRDSDPHSSTEMAMLNFFMYQITTLAKQREYWSFVHGLFLLHRFSLIPGSGPFITMMVKQYRDALRIYLEPGHPFEQMWSQVADEVDQQQQLHGAPLPGVVPLAAIEVYMRCVDDHLRSHFGRLDYTYQDSHLRLLINASRPCDYAAEVFSLVDDAGFPASDMRFILSSVLAEELMKECVYIELRRFSPNASSLPPGGPTPSTRSPSFEEASEEDEGGFLPFDEVFSTDRDAVDVLVRLIGRLQTAARSGRGLGPEALRRIKMEAATVIGDRDDMGQDSTNTSSPSYTM
ncbi:hypothetical protein MGG_06630 [Pyricularia oryzae 70-15]|uniref:Clr5 domain-containing protein n=1 Tax=Pyricularia oryzae (strain 70-15 / ATCC MYA-4617 / FGSC 8958) TaxID=242507 RepID=G4N602_PYRO7|nr:uncharacterized protein MGG_06630 [Pyricularia oryzae 70-15]EHA50578.1 hypothetical protein MGG_06630 [Pyricularia oryzae 70-15]KAI7919194.1 hypothetical protein M9X92_006505 [Pyricularia oryzae]